MIKSNLEVAASQILPMTMAMMQIWPTIIMEKQEVRPIQIMHNPYFQIIRLNEATYIYQMIKLND